MSFELPDKPGATSSELRELEQSAPNVTPKAIRSALMRAAQELEKREKSMADALRVLEEAKSIKVSAMDSQSRSHEINVRVSGAINSAIVSLRG